MSTLSHHHHWPVTLVGLLLLTGGGVAQEQADERYRLEVITNELRSYFSELSDAEYASIRPQPTLFPVLTPLWARGPFGSHDVTGYDSPKYSTDALIQFQEPLLDPESSPLSRSRTVYELAGSCSPTAEAMIVRQLEREVDDAVVADLLKSLTALGATDLARLVRPWIDSPVSAVRHAAYELYSRQTEADIGLLLARAAAETDSTMRCRALDCAAARAEEVKIEVWLPFWKSEDVPTRVSACRAIVRLPAVQQYQEDVMAICRGPVVPLKRALAESLHNRLNPDFCSRVLGQLAKDESSSVRAAVSEAVSRLELPPLLPLLIDLADDPRAEVRVEVARALRKFPIQEAFQALVVGLGGDGTSRLVREAARDSLIAFDPRFPIKPRIVEALRSENEFVRCVGYQVVSILKTDLHKELIASQLKQETNAENIRFAIRALAYGDGRQAADLILGFADHADEQVRAAVAAAVGELRIMPGKPILSGYALNDRSQVARSAALFSMGQLAEPEFADSLLEVLKRTNLSRPNASTEEDRAISAWAISRLPNPSKPILNRMKAIITTPVIQTEMGPAFDGDLVRVSCCWAIVDLSRRNPTESELVTLAKEMIEVLKMNDPDPTTMSGSGLPIPTSDMLRAYGAEAASFLAGLSVNRVPVPLGEYRFRFAPYEQR